jgi:hypothetical protein
VRHRTRQGLLVLVVASLLGAFAGSLLHRDQPVTLRRVRLWEGPQLDASSFRVGDTTAIRLERVYTGRIADDLRARTRRIAAANSCSG